MHWNYRVVRRKAPSGHTWLGVHEVYYNDAGKADMCTEDPEITVEEAEGVEGLLAILKTMTKDVKRSKRDIINYEDIK